MGDRKVMPKVDMHKEFAKLSESDQHFVRKIEQMNKTRATQMKTLRGKGRTIGALLGVGVLGIYFYTLTAIKQEKFLDDFDELPKQTSQSSAS